MGRLRQFDRDTAVTWVMNEIWRVGFAACSVKSISENLCITRSSFYNTFESREALFIEALQCYFKQSPDRKLADFANSKHPLVLMCEVFKEACRMRASDLEHRGCLAVNGVSELVGVNESLGPPLEDAIQQGIKHLEALLTHSMSLGELAPTSNIKTLALALQSLLMGINTLSKVIKSEQQLWATTQLTLRALGVYREK